tara:strand:- start:520 stop:660 length:141 start_codon:yes stop_codon:yes gene_type:complete
MAMNELSKVAEVLRDESAMRDKEIRIDPEIAKRAMVPLQRMLDFPR